MTPPAWFQWLMKGTPINMSPASAAGRTAVAEPAQKTYIFAGYRLVCTVYQHRKRAKNPDYPTEPAPWMVAWSAWFGRGDTWRGYGELWPWALPVHVEVSIDDGPAVTSEAGVVMLKPPHKLRRKVGIWARLTNRTPAIIQGYDTTTGCGIPIDLILEWRGRHAEKSGELISFISGSTRVRMEMRGISGIAPVFTEAIGDSEEVAISSIAWDTIPVMAAARRMRLRGTPEWKDS